MLHNFFSYSPPIALSLEEISQEFNVQKDSSKHGDFERYTI
jgi:hypothetical protein